MSGKEISKETIEIYNKIKINDISSDWILKQKINQKGRDGLRALLEKQSKYGAEITRLNLELKNLIIECIYSLPQVDTSFQQLPRDFIYYSDTGNGNLGDISFRFSPEAFGFGSQRYYIDPGTGIGLGDVRRVGFDELSHESFQKTGSDFVINIRHYEWPKNSALPPNIIEILKTTPFFDNIDWGLKEKVKNLYIQLLDLYHLQANHLSKYKELIAEGYQGFLYSTKTMKELKSKFPELYEPYFEVEKVNLLERYKETDEGKKLMAKFAGRGETEELVMKIRMSLDYL